MQSLTPVTPDRVQRHLVVSGACMFAIGLVTGLWSAAALTGTVKVGMPRLALAAHLNGLLGGFWLICVSVTVPYLAYAPEQLSRLRWLVILPSWANWAVTLVASFLGVNGLTYGSDTRNNLIAVLLQALVVIPSLAGAAYWVRGLVRRRSLS